MKDSTPSRDGMQDASRIVPRIASPNPLQNANLTAPSVDGVTLSDAAQRFVDAGFAVCLLRPGEKTPKAHGWTAKSASPAAFLVGGNIGILTGARSNGGRPGFSLVCLDIDYAKALMLAPAILPATGMIDGRNGRRCSHWWYSVPNDSIPPGMFATASQAVEALNAEGLHVGPRTRHLKHPKLGMIVELKGTGAQVVAPPSKHASGEDRGWEGGVRGEPSTVEWPILWAAMLAFYEAATGEAFADTTTPKEKQPKPSKAKQPKLSPMPDAPPAPAEPVAPSPAEPPTIEVAEGVAFDGTDVVLSDGIRITLPDRMSRALKYLAKIPDEDLSQAGKGGHSQILRHFTALVDGFGLRNPECSPAVTAELRGATRELASVYKARIVAACATAPDAERAAYEEWTAEQIDHKIDEVWKLKTLPGKPIGHFLVDAAPLRRWDSAKTIADELEKTHIIRAVKGNPFHYVGGYDPIDDATFSGIVRGAAERCADREHKRLQQKNGADRADLDARVKESQQHLKELAADSATTRRAYDDALEKGAPGKSDPDDRERPRTTRRCTACGRCPQERREVGERAGDATQ